MSHFSVLVVTKEKPEVSDLENIMAPYQEVFEPDNKYVIKEDITEEILEDYNTQELSVVINDSNGEVLCPLHANEASQYKVYDEKEHQEVLREGYSEGRVLANKLFSTLNEFSEYWYDESLDSQGKAYRYHNPEAKWDWWSVGGRWGGFFKAKDRSQAELGTTSAFGTRKDETGSDVIQKGNVDVEGMLAEAKEKGIKDFEEFMALFPEGGMPQKTWMDCVNEFDRSKEGFDRDKCKELHESQPNMDIVDKYAKDKQIFFGDPIEMFCRGDKEAFLKKTEYNTVGTYAVIYEGKWMQKGNMGLWGMSSNEDDNWEENYMEFFNNLPDETWFTVIDCHI